MIWVLALQCSGCFFTIKFSLEFLPNPQFWSVAVLKKNNLSSCVVQILIRNRVTDLDARMNDGTTPLILAARLAVEGMVAELINCQADVNAVDDHGNVNTMDWAGHILVVVQASRGWASALLESGLLVNSVVKSDTGLSCRSPPSSNRLQAWLDGPGREAEEI